MAATNIATYRQALEKDRRDKISITRCLTHLTEIEEEVRGLCRPIKGENGELMPRISAAHIGALRLRADINMALLKKRLPDLKAVELTGPDGGPIQYEAKPFSFTKPGPAAET